MNEPLCLVVNPAAGGGRALRTLATATAALDGARARYQVQPSASLAHARELAAAAAQRGEVTVAVGGDGLAGALAGAVADAGGVMALIPAGRGNDLARELGLPPGAAAAAAAILDGQQAELDLLGLSIPGQPEETAALSAYLGLPSVAGEIANRSRLIRGPATYPVAALRALVRWRPVSFRVEQTGGPGGPVAGIPAGEFPGYGVVLANSRFFGGGMQVCPPARTSDGCLDVVVMHDAHEGRVPARAAADQGRDARLAAAGRPGPGRCGHGHRGHRAAGRGGRGDAAVGLPAGRRGAAARPRAARRAEGDRAGRTRPLTRCRPAAGTG